MLWPCSAGPVEGACTYGPPPSWSPPALCQGLLVPIVLSVKAACMCRTHSSSHPWLQSLIPSPQISSRWKPCLENTSQKPKDLKVSDLTPSSQMKNSPNYQTLVQRLSKIHFPAANSPTLKAKALTSQNRTKFDTRTNTKKKNQHLNSNKTQTLIPSTTISS